MLGVSVDTAPRWEADGRLGWTGPRAASGSSTIDEVSRLLDERRQAADGPADRRPVGPQPVPGHRHPGRARRGRRGRRGHRRSASAGQPDDGRGRRRARPQGRRRGGLRRQGDQRHRRDPVVEGVALMKPRRPCSSPSSLLVLAACSSGGASSAPSVRRPRPPRPPPRRSAADSRRRRRPHDLRRGVAQEASSTQAKTAYEAANPGDDADDLDRLVVGARDPDRAGRPGRRLPVGRHDEPEEARRQGPRRRRPGRPSPATS